MTKQITCLVNFKKKNKNISFFTSHKKLWDSETVRLQDFTFLDLSLSIFLSLSHSISCSLPLSFSYSLSLYIPLYLHLLLYTQRKVFIKWSMIIKVTWGHFYVLWFKKKIWSFDQITTLTYVLMENFCSCFWLSL